MEQLGDQVLNKLLEKYKVYPCFIQDIANFVETWHYSRNVNGIISDHCFKMTDRETRVMVGAAIFGKMAMANQWRKYAEQESDITELRRLVCIDNTEKNIESYMIGRCLKWLRDNTDIKAVVSYADPNYGHQGTIYKATNFQYLGQSSPGKVIVWKGKKYHDKAIRTSYRGELKPFAKKLKQALQSGEATYQKVPGKHIYLYKINRKRFRGEQGKLNID